MAADLVQEVNGHGKDLAEKELEPGQAAQSGSSDAEDGSKSEDEVQAGTAQAAWDWDTDPHNPYNWPRGKKAMQVGIIASIAFLA